MSWLFRYRCRTAIRSSLCMTPIACMVAALVLAPVIRTIDDRTRWVLMDFGPEGSKAVIAAIAASLLTFIVFSFSIILLVVQMSSAQLSPRIIERILESRLAKRALGVFVFSFTYTLAVLGRIEARATQLPVVVVVFLSLFSIAMFLYLIQKIGQTLRPVMILAWVAADTRAAIQNVYPNPFSSSESREFATSPFKWSIAHEGGPGVLLAFDKDGLVEIARRSACVIELVPQVGDFVVPGVTLFRLHGSNTGELEEDRLRRSVALGPERVLEKDPAFGFRILVDIASKALSPAINDPTTGALTVDQIQHLLHLLSNKELGRAVVRDSSGKVRLLYRTPTWEDFVTLAVTEIRDYGAKNPQVTRRLQAMLVQLLQVVPAARAGTLRKEMSLLARTIESAFADPEDRVLAGTADLQGFGSPTLARGEELTEVRQQLAKN
jgi:uncharacterized membrane protein